MLFSFFSFSALNDSSANCNRVMNQRLMGQCIHILMEKMTLSFLVIKKMRHVLSHYGLTSNDLQVEVCFRFWCHDVWCQLKWNILWIYNISFTISCLCWWLKQIYVVQNLPTVLTHRHICQEMQANYLTDITGPLMLGFMFAWCSVSAAPEVCSPSAPACSPSVVKRALLRW